MIRYGVDCRSRNIVGPTQAPPFQPGSRGGPGSSSYLIPMIAGLASLAIIAILITVGIYIRRKRARQAASLVNPYGSLDRGGRIMPGESLLGDDSLAENSIN